MFVDSNGEAVVYEDLPDADLEDGSLPWDGLEESPLPWDEDYEGDVTDFKELDDGTIIFALHYHHKISGQHQKGYEEDEDNFVLMYPPGISTEDSYRPRATYRLNSLVFLYKNKYSLRIRYKTDVDQPSPLTIIQKRNETVESNQTVFFKSTNGEWGITEPLVLESLIGGELSISGKEVQGKTSLESLIKFTHSGDIAGEMGLIIDELAFIPMAPGTDVRTSDDRWIAHWYRTLKSEVRTKVIPELNDALVESALNIFESELKTTEPAADLMHKNHNSGQREAYQANHELMIKAQNETMKVALPLLDSLDKKLEGLFEKHHKLLIRFMVLRDRRTARYSYTGVEAKQTIVNLFSIDTNIPLLKEMFIHGVPEGGNLGRNDQFGYVNAISVYNSIQANKVKNADNYRALRKLAIAVAAELSSQSKIDPLARYKHYEEAYLTGELDSYFEYLTIWEMRMAINSPQTDEELSWGRQAFQQFSPQSVYHKWGYSTWMVDYKRPNWKVNRDDMRVVLADGGLCGPRAVWARFTHQAFGLPVWGVQQPAHGAFNRWIEQRGWNTALTRKPIEISSWQLRNALDFRMETEYRQRFGDFSYVSKVSILEYFARAMNEPRENIRTRKYASTDPNALFYSLAILQRRRYYHLGWLRKERDGEPEVESKIEALIQRVDETQDNFQVLNNGTIIIPAARTTFGKRKGQCAKSYEGGQQVSLSAKGQFELHYQISPEVNWAERKKYLLSIKLATSKPPDLKNVTHQVPMTVKVTSDYNENNMRVRSSMDYKISVPYTKALFQWTEPIEIDLGGGVEDFQLTMPKANQKLTVKELRLQPADGIYGFHELLEIPNQAAPTNSSGSTLQKTGSIDPDTGVITIPPLRRNVRDRNIVGVKRGWTVYDSIYGDSHAHVYFPDGFHRFNTQVWDHVEDQGLDSKEYEVRIVYRTHDHEGSEPGWDKPIKVTGNAVDFEIGISNTNHAVKESDAVVVDFKDNGTFLKMSRDEGCKWPVMFMGLKLTPTSGFEKPVEPVDERVDDEPIEMQENFQVFQNGTMVIPGAKTMGEIEQSSGL